MIQRLGVRAPILLVGGLIVTMAMEPRLGAVLLAMMPLMGLTIWLISRKGIPMYMKPRNGRPDGTDGTGKYCRYPHHQGTFQGKL